MMANNATVAYSTHCTWTLIHVTMINFPKALHDLSVLQSTDLLTRIQPECALNMSRPVLSEYMQVPVAVASSCMLL